MSFRPIIFAVPVYSSLPCLCLSTEGEVLHPLIRECFRPRLLIMGQLTKGYCSARGRFSVLSCRTAARLSDGRVKLGTNDYKHCVDCPLNNTFQTCDGYIISETEVSMGTSHSFSFIGKDSFLGSREPRSHDVGLSLAIP